MQYLATLAFFLTACVGKLAAEPPRLESGVYRNDNNAEALIAREADQMMIVIISGGASTVDGAAPADCELHLGLNGIESPVQIYPFESDIMHVSHADIESFHAEINIVNTREFALVTNYGYPLCGMGVEFSGNYAMVLQRD